MTTISRRRLLTLPALALMQSWPDRANRKPEPMTVEELTQKMQVRIGVDQIHSQILGEHTRWLRWLVEMVGGDIYPPARGDV